MWAARWAAALARGRRLLRRAARRQVSSPAALAWRHVQGRCVAEAWKAVAVAGSLYAGTVLSAPSSKHALASELVSW